VLKRDVFLAVFVAVFLFSAFMIVKPLVGKDVKITGYAASGSAISNVTVTKNFAITLSSNLSAGIQFGNLSTISDANGTGNLDSTSSGNLSTYNVSVDTGATINVDFCVGANVDMTDSDNANVIGLNNESYANSSLNNVTFPKISEEVELTTGNGVKAGEDIAPGEFVHYRFWLDVPSIVASGTYNNTLTFTGKETGVAC